MAQCEKTLANSDRCSNQAIPGTTYCQMHRRIVFRQALDTERVDTAPLPMLKDKMASPSAPVAESKTKAEQQNWRASPSAAGQKPIFPGLQADERDILVAPQGIIWLQAEAADTPTSQFSRLVRLMGFLSQAFPLSGQVRVLSQTEGTNYILHLTPNQTNAAQLSVFYDSASDAARLVHGSLYIGQKRAFVQYRDDGAPRGYDVSAFKAPANNNELLLVAHWGSQFLSLSGFTKTSLRDLCLHVSPLPGTTDQVPELVYALVPPALYPLLAKYFHAHHLSYRLARLQASVGELILFELGPRPDAPIGQVVPAFILDYLSRLPRVVLLIQAHQSGDLSILLQWKHRYPLHLPHIAAAFAPNEMLLLVADHYPNLLIKPTPQFFDGDQLVDVHLPSAFPLDSLGFGVYPFPVGRRRESMSFLDPLEGTETSPKVVSLTQLPAHLPPTALKLEVVLRPDNGPTPPVAALILSAQEMTWLRQLLYLLPGEAFSDYTLYQGAELSVLVGNNRPIEGLPFGMPLRRPSNRALFIPLRSRFMPALPWPLLQEALAIKEHVYTFLTPDYRLDLPENLFAPLSRILVAEPHRPRVNVRMLAPSSLPALAWTPPPEPAPSTETSPDKTKKSSFSARKAQTSVREPVVPTPQNAKLEEAALWREKARACEESHDFLSAAVCYNFLNDVTNSARCYRQAATQLRTKENEGK